MSDLLTNAANGLFQTLGPGMLLLILLGALGGMIMGSMPGLSATVGLALLLPITFTMDPLRGLVLMGAFYMGAIYGGSYTAILVNAPGTPSSIATAFDGYPMTRQGRSEEAIVAVTVASLFGGVIGVLGLTFLGPLLAEFVLNFGSQEYFWIGIFGLTIIASLAGRSLIKGLIGGAIGLLISTIGIAPVGGGERFTFGYLPLQGGIDLIVALIGFFTIPAVIDMVVDPGSRTAEMIETDEDQGGGVLIPTIRRVLSRPWNLLRSCFIGTVVGAMPGAGGNVANLVAYNEAKRASRHPERFGEGEIDGVVAPEGANNAVVGGGLIPLLTLGIPGAPPDAVIYGVLVLHGLRPGNDLFTSQADLTYTFMASIGVAAIVMVPVGLLAGRAVQRAVVNMPTNYLAPGVIVLTIVGAYAVRNNVIDVVFMLLLGFLGYALRYLGIQPSTIVLGIVLGPIIEQGLVQGLLSSGRDMPWVSFFTDPLSLVIIALIVAGALGPTLASRFQRNGGTDEEEGREE